MAAFVAFWVGFFAGVSSTGLSGGRLSGWLETGGVTTGAGGVGFGAAGAPDVGADVGGVALCTAGGWPATAPGEVTGDG
jgi:hypothetical protein